MSYYLEKNIEVVKDRHYEIEVNEDILNRLSNLVSVDRPSDYNGMMLQSNVDQHKAIEVWCNQFEDIKYNTIVVVFGLGNIDYYAEFVKRFPDTLIIAFEPSEDLFYNSLSCDDYSQLLKEARIHFCLGDRKYGELYNVLRGCLDFNSTDIAYYTSIPNATKLFREEYEHFEEIAVQSAEKNIASRNTIIAQEDVNVDNLMNNIKIVTQESGIDELRRSLMRIDNLKDYPAIIISAGPSLDKNIHELRNVNGRAFTICVDAAYNTAIKNSIRPNIVITIDPNSTDKFMREKKDSDIPLVTQLTGSVSIREAFVGRKFYSSDGRDYFLEIIPKYGKELVVLGTGGSVANSAFSLARVLGFDKIVLIGQDLGFPNNKMHAQDTYIEEEGADQMIEDLFDVESVDGGTVKTSLAMDSYKQWFERMADVFPDIEIIDATEGGALIAGTKVMTLREAISEYCPKDETNFDEYVDSADYFFSEEEKEDVNKAINKTFEDVDNNIDYLNKIKRDYYKLRDLNEKRKYRTSEFKRIIEIIGEHNKYLEENKNLELYKMYCSKSYYKFVDSLKDIEEDEYKNIKNIVTSSIAMIDAYIEAAKKLKQKWNDVCKTEQVSR